MKRLIGLELAAAAVLAFGQTPSTRTFEVASIKPSDPSAVGLSITADKGRFTATNATLKQLITFAYDIPDSRLFGEAKGLDKTRFNIVATIPGGDVTLQTLRPMVQLLLRDRFQLAVHQETRELPFYALVVDKTGPKIVPLEAVDGAGQPGMRNNGPGRWTGTRTSMAILANVLSRQTRVSVQDQTGLTGAYNFTLEWTPDSAGQANAGGEVPASADDRNGPSIFTAIREQLGLRLDPRKGPGAVIVIDHVANEPIEN